MATTFLLLRHAAHDNVGGFLAGRLPGIRLGEAGRAQARRLGERLADLPLDAILASPRERTQETAAAVAEGRAGLAVTTEPDLDEIDFGRWSGQTFDRLNEDPDWRRWNAARSLASTPAGETMFDVQTRALRAIRRLRRDFPEGTVAFVTHADVIKAAVAFHLGLPLDAWPRFDIAPASITRLELDDWHGLILGLNERVE